MSSLINGTTTSAIVATLTTTASAIVTATLNATNTLSESSTSPSSYTSSIIGTPSSSPSPTSLVQNDSSDSGSNTTKIIGISLAVGSGLLIGSSFVFKKKGLINCTKEGMVAGEGHAYLKSTMWWTGMIMMIAGEICNFVAYAFVQPILVTPLGALSVVICAILSSIFLYERLNLQGKVGCAQCIVGATIIVLHAPEQPGIKTIQQFHDKMLHPIFITWMVLLIGASLFLTYKVAPKYGKSNMMVYIGICSLIGSLSVVSTQGLGAAIVHTISTGEPQFNTWFIYFVLVFVVVTLLVEINFLNKALNLFNTAMVTPTYYVTFTSTTIITSAVLYQGFASDVLTILTVCLGFLVICGGILLLQTSKPAVVMHVHGPSGTGGGTLSFDDFEPTAADMRASPFSSLRRIGRETRASAQFPMPSSPLNPRAESLLIRKRRASNAAMNQQHHHQQGTRPTSMVSTLAAASGTVNPITTMIMGANGSQVRLQLCEIVLTDENSETSRVQVYRPIGGGSVIAGDGSLLKPPGPLYATSATSSGITAHSSSYYHALQQPTSQSTHLSVTPRGNLLSDTLTASVRFSRRKSRAITSPTSSTRLSAAEAGALGFGPNSSNITSSEVGTTDGMVGSEDHLHTLDSTPASSPPPQPSQQAPPSRPVGSPTSGPLVLGGSFFIRPKQYSGALGEIPVIEPVRGTTVISIEPVEEPHLGVPTLGTPLSLKTGPADSSDDVTSAGAGNGSDDQEDGDGVDLLEKQQQASQQQSSLESNLSAASDSTGTGGGVGSQGLFGRTLGRLHWNFGGHHNNNGNSNTTIHNNTHDTNNAALTDTTDDHATLNSKSLSSSTTAATLGMAAEIKEKKPQSYNSSSSSSTVVVDPSFHHNLAQRNHHPTRISEGEEEEDVK